MDAFLRPPSPPPVDETDGVQSGTQSQFLSRAEHASQQAVPGSFLWFICLLVCMSCFVSRVLYNRGCEGTVIWVGSFGGAREPSRPAAYYARWGGGGG